MKKTAMLVGVLAACGPGTRPGNGDDTGGGIDAHHVTQPMDAPPPPPPDAALVTYVYAHTSSTLFRVDPDTLAITQVGNFVWPATVVFDQMTDIAIDSHGVMIGVSFDKIYKIDPTTGITTLLASNLGNSFNGLSYVPASMLGETGDDVLIGTRNADGMVFRVDPMTGATSAVGNMGAFTSSGDLVAVSGSTLQTVLGNGSGDQLVSLAPSTFAATPIGTTIGFSTIWGLAYWKGTCYGFTDAGQFISIDPMTGVGTLITSMPGQAWWGAAVTTLAPTIQ